MTEQAQVSTDQKKSKKPQRKRPLIAKRYEVINKLTGGMGIVYLCRDQTSNQLVALKTFKPEFLSHVAARDLFLREGTMWVELGKHPHIVQAYRVERIGDGREVYLVLEWIVQPKGKGTPSLRSWLKGGQILPPEQALLFSLHVARGMKYATNKIPGLVHRDLKPENILVGYDGMARVTDFGLASTLSSLKNTKIGSLANAKENFGRTQLTQGVAGTPLYMAPEQWANKQLDARADIYALGCILYEMVTGRFAAEGNDREALRDFHLSGRIKPPPSSTPRVLLRVLRRCLVAPREKRYRDWHEVEAALESAYEQVTGEPAPEEKSAGSETQHERIGAGHSYNTMGLSYLDIGKLDVAVMYFEQAVHIGRAEGSIELEGAGLGNLGLAYTALGYLDRAIEFHEEHIGIAKKLENLAEEGKALGNLGHAYLRLGEVERAIHLHERELAIFQQLSNRFKEATALHSLGDSYRQAGNIKQAVDFYQQSLAIARDIGDRTRVERILNSMGLVYLDSGESKEAVTLFQKAMEIAHEIGDKVGEAEILSNVGDLYRSLDYADRAIDHYNRALIMAQNSNDRRREIRNLNNLGDIYLDLKDPEEAKEYYAAALEAVRDTGDQIQEMQTFLKLGETYYLLGDYMQTASLAKRALEIARDIEDWRTERVALEKIGDAYGAWGDLGRTAGYLEEVLAILRQHEDVEGEIEILDKLGGIYGRISQWKTATKTYQTMLALLQAREDWEGISDALNKLGDVARLSGKSKVAIEYFREGLEVAREHKIPYMEAVSLSNIGLAYNDMNKKWRATWNLDKGISAAKKSKDLATYGLASYRMALVLGKQGKWQKAEPHATRARKIYAQLGDELMQEKLTKMLAEIERQKERTTGFFFF